MAIAVLFVFAAIVLRNSPLFVPSHEKIYQEYRQIFAKVQELSERKASAEEWAAFDQDAQARLSSLVAPLVKEHKQTPLIGAQANSTVNYYIRQPLIQIGKYDLPKLMQHARAKEPREIEIQNIEKQLQDVRRVLDAVNMNAPAQPASG